MTNVEKRSAHSICITVNATVISNILDMVMIKHHIQKYGICVVGFRMLRMIWIVDTILKTSISVRIVLYHS